MSLFGWRKSRILPAETTIIETHGIHADTVNG